MDKELLRVVIIATGLVVIMGMLLWTFIKNRNSEQDGNLLDNLGFKFDNLGFKRGSDKPAKTVEATATPKKSARYELPEEEESEDLFADFDFEEEEEENQPPSPRFVTPEIIQFSIIAKADEGFNGLDLLNAFQIVGLEYGSLKIFERLDPNRLVDFGVACMVEPGTFPSTDLEEFFCPGIVFFMQPAALGDAMPVFDDFVDTIKLLSIELDGEILDHQRKPLTDATIDMIRQSL